MFGDTPVNYVVPGSWQQTTHSYDTAFLRLRVFTWRFRSPTSRVVLWWPFLDILGGVVCDVRRHTSQLRRVSGSLSPTTHSQDTTLMRFRDFTWRCRVPRSQVVLWWPFLDILGGVVCDVRRHTSQLRRVSGSFHVFVSFLGIYSGTNRLKSGISQWLRDFVTRWEDKPCESSSPNIIPYIRVIFGCLLLHKYTWWQWLLDRICVWLLCGLDSGILQWLHHFDVSWEHKSSEIHK